MVKFYDDDDDDDDDDELLIKNCFCGMVDHRKALGLIFNRYHCIKFSPLPISDTLQTKFEPAQNLSSEFVERNCAAVITTKPRGFLTGFKQVLRSFSRRF